jgi:hypothetical protein
MLLQLFDHHQELFMTVIEYLLAANRRSLCALRAVNMQLCKFISDMDLYQHYVKYQRVLKSHNIHRMIFGDNTSLVTIISKNNELRYYILIYTRPQILKISSNSQGGDNKYIEYGIDHITHIYSPDIHTLPNWVIEHIRSGQLIIKNNGKDAILDIV